MSETWYKSDRWRKYSKTFEVQIIYWDCGYCSKSTGPHRWNVYAYIYGDHPLSDIFDSPTRKDWIAIDALEDYFHGRYSFREEMKVKSALIYPPSHSKCLKIGSDYNHDGDEKFSYMDTLEKAKEVHADADRLFFYLKKLESEAIGENA